MLMICVDAGIISGESLLNLVSIEITRRLGTMVSPRHRITDLQKRKQWGASKLPVASIKFFRRTVVWSHGLVLKSAFPKQ